MEVDLAPIGPRKIEYVERVRIKSSLVARSARTAKAFTMLLCRNRDSPAYCAREARADLRSDPNATGTQALCLELGYLSADPADFLHLASVEETQAYRGHFWFLLCLGCGNGIADVERTTINPDAVRSCPAESTRYIEGAASVWHFRVN
jgi:hypothetical protein